MSKRMTRSQTIFLENSTSHFKQLIKNPKISTSTKSKTTPVKRKIEACLLDDASNVLLESKNISVPVKPQDSSTNGISDSSFIKQLAVNEPITSTEHKSKPHIEKVRQIRRNTNSEAITTRPPLVAIASIANSEEPIRTIRKRSHEDASVTSQPTIIDQNMPISSRPKTFTSPRLPQRRSERFKKPILIDVQPKKTARQKTVYSDVLHSVPVNVSNPKDIPSSSTKTVSHRRKTQTYECKKPAEDKISSLKLNSNYGKNGKIEIIIPSELKALLIDDAIIIKRQRKFYKIPATQNVAQVIDDYIALKQHENHNEISINQICGSIIAYFNTLLANQLLYESERIYHLDVINNFPGENVSKLYTPIYLLRLLIQLDSLIKFSKIDNGALQSTVNYVNELVKYLAENQSIFSDMNSFN